MKNAVRAIFGIGVVLCLCISVLALSTVGVPAGSVNQSEGNNSVNKTEYIHVYDFSTGAGTDRWAYRYQINQTEFDSGSPIYPNTVFTQTQYTNISADDSLNVSDVTTDDGNYSAHRFNISIAENVLDITKINVTWNGKGWHDSGDMYNGTYLYIYNFTSGSYGSAIASNENDAEVNLTGEVTSGISNYINSGNVTVLAKQKNYQTSGLGTKRSHIETDYVKLYVYTYS